MMRMFQPVGPVVGALAVARLTSLITEDEITEPIRSRVTEWSDRYPEGSVPDRLGYLVSCQRCVSVWAAGGVLVASYFRPTRPLVRILAASQAALAANAGAEWLDAAVSATNRYGA